MTTTRRRAEPSFLKREVAPHRRRIVSHPNFRYSVIFAIAGAGLGWLLEAHGRIEAADGEGLLGALLTMASITLGFLTTAIVMTLSISRGTLDELLSTSGKWGPGRSPFAHLSFTFVWSALMQVMLIVVVLADLVLLRVRGPLGSGLSLFIGTTILIFAVLYAIAQFVTAILTLSLVSDVIDRGPADNYDWESDPSYV